jgi:hypothetical protein
MAFIDRPLVRYRYTSGSLSSDKLFSARSALEVIEQFWREHPDYAASHAHVYHRSLGRHLMNAGAAAATQRRRTTAVEYLLRSLRHNARQPAAWKWLTKTLILPANRLASGGARPRTEATPAAR